MRKKASHPFRGKSEHGFKSHPLKPSLQPMSEVNRKINVIGVSSKASKQQLDAKKRAMFGK